MFLRFLFVSIKFQVIFDVHKIYWIDMRKIKNSEPVNMFLFIIGNE